MSAFITASESQSFDWGLESGQPQTLTQFLWRIAELSDGPLTKSASFPYGVGQRIHLWKMGRTTVLALTQGKKFLGCRKSDLPFNRLVKRYDKTQQH